MKKLLTALVVPLMFCGCEDTDGLLGTDCETCNEKITEYYNKLTKPSNCQVYSFDIDLTEFCSDYIAAEAAGVMRETCSEDNTAIVNPSCPSIGRNNVPFDVYVYGTIPDTVNVDIEYDGIDVNQDLYINQSSSLIFSGFLPAGDLVNVKLYKITGNQEELMRTATPKITYARSEYTIEFERSIEVRYDSTDGYRLYFYNWE